ncbi:MAG: efflux RND transporter periplasmic adaptor subunit, partial [Planctomycetaceae bacterium]|nr:efflux RND transporter periplasmic adaptor subunit [Planctomycetaceae bacterium]
GSTASSSSDGETTHEVHVVLGKPHTEQIELPGASVHGYETTQLMAKLGGYVDQIMNSDGQPVSRDEKEIDIGSFVKEGTVLAELDIPEIAGEVKQKDALLTQANSAVSQAMAAIAQAQAEVERRNAEVAEAEAMVKEKLALKQLRETAHRRIVKLFNDGAVGEDSKLEAEFGLAAAEAAVTSADAGVTKAKSLVAVANEMVKKAEADKESADAHVNVATADLEIAKVMDDYSTIRAPYNGMITKRLVDNGAFVRPATSNSGAMALFEITRTDKVRIEAAVPSVNTTRIRVGQQAVFHTIGGLPGVTITGQVDRAAVALDRETRMMRIHVDFKNPLKNRSTGKVIRLDPGMYGSIRIIIKKWDKIPVIPASALAEDAAGQSFVVVVDAAGVCEKRAVDVAFNDAEEVGVSHGLEIGDTVVKSDIGKLKDGQEISIKSP